MDCIRAVEEKLDCDECRRANKRFGREPPCDTCLPDLMPENLEVFKVYNMACNQVIASPDGPIDLNINALDTVMNWMQIDNRLETATRVLQVFHKRLKEARELQRLKRMAEDG